MVKASDFGGVSGRRSNSNKRLMTRYTPMGKLLSRYNDTEF